MVPRPCGSGMVFRGYSDEDTEDDPAGAWAASNSAARVCQPLPLARQRRNTSSSNLSVVGRLCCA